MADLPILFSGAMVRAILREIEEPGTGKTQTRRVLSPQPSEGSKLIGLYAPGLTAVFNRGDDPQNDERVRLRYIPGDRLYVREAWRVGERHDSLKPSDLPSKAMTMLFEAGGSIANQRTPGNWQPSEWPAVGEDIRWAGRRRPAMFLPRWASRITLIAEAVQVQRLQDISEADAVAEGMTPDPVSGRYLCGADEVGPVTAKSAITAFGWLWNEINGKRAGCHWQDNPWVAAYTFRPILGNIDMVAA